MARVGGSVAALLEPPYVRNAASAGQRPTKGDAVLGCWMCVTIRGWANWSCCDIALSCKYERLPEPE